MTWLSRSSKLRNIQEKFSNKLSKSAECSWFKYVCIRLFCPYTSSTLLMLIDVLYLYVRAPISLALLRYHFQNTKSASVLAQSMRSRSWDYKDSGILLILKSWPVKPVAYKAYFLILHLELWGYQRHGWDIMLITSLIRIRSWSLTEFVQY